MREVDREAQGYPSALTLYTFLIFLKKSQVECLTQQYMRNKSTFLCIKCSMNCTYPN